MNLNRRLRQQYKFLFKPYNSELNKDLVANMSGKEKIVWRNKKKAAKTKVVISPKLDRWKHPDVFESIHSSSYKDMIQKKKHHTMISPLKKRIRGIPVDTQLGNKTLRNIIKETDEHGAARYLDVTQTTPGLNMAETIKQHEKMQKDICRMKKKKAEERPPSRLNEELREETLGKIRTKFVYNRFDWNASGRFVPSHHPFNPRLYSNAERVYTINAAKIKNLS